MAKVNTSGKTHTPIVKSTRQGGKNPKTSSMTKTRKRAYKAYRGQGR